MSRGYLSLTVSTLSQVPRSGNPAQPAQALDTCVAPPKRIKCKHDVESRPASPALT
jgi:hypothetical protein